MAPSTRRGVVALAAVLLLALAPGTALGQDTATPSGPSAAERATTLTSPAVVFITTGVGVKIRVTIQNAFKASGLSHVDDSFQVPIYAFGSGFVVNPDGVVVTASHVVEPEEQKIRNYAANNLILEGLGYSYPKSTSSEYDQYNLTDSRFLNNLLHQCYKGIACQFQITPAVSVFSAVDIAQTTKAKGVPARVLGSSGFENTDIAVLQVEKNNLPTAALASSAGDLASGDEITALGFPYTSVESFQSGVTEPAKVFGHISSVRTEGTSQVIEIDANIENGESGGPAVNDQGQVIGLVSYSIGTTPGQSYLRTIDDIKAGLSAAGVQAQRGPVDQAFENGMDYVWAHHYAAAVPQLRKAVTLYDGFPLAKKFLAEAEEKKGTAADVPLDTGGGFPIVLVAVIAGAVVVVVVIVALVAGRRKRAPAPAMAGVAATPMQPTMPMQQPAAPTPMVAPPPATPLPPAPGPTPPQEPATQEPPAAPPPTAPSEPPAAPAQPAGEEGVHFCSNCGHQVEAGEHFCPNCGHKLV